MKPTDRARLTTALRDHVAKIAADLRAKMRASGSAARAAAEQLHKDERVAEDFEVWTDLLSRRAAVLWVLKSVYVRVLEDRGLLQPGRLLDPEAQQLFEKLAPNLGETAFLRWIYKDLASTHGGVPELFSPQPAEVAQPSDDLSRALIAFWRHRDADTGAVWSFAEEKFEGELMGDLYQELDPIVKDRFALCQTPDFVRAFILDRTLTPAVETFGADEVRLLDPACGSGHFLIDGLKRLVAATAAKHVDWDRAKVVAHALDRVVGVDLNDYACALARTRLIMTAAELAGVTKLADAARFHPHVYWADGLEQVEKEEQKPSLQFSFFEKVEERPRATLTRSDVRAALKKVFEKKFHAVVANPPYILERDEARKAYHRELVGKSRRYVSAAGKYSLGSPFTERCFQLAEKDGFVGLITGNNFMKREFGKPLIEKILSGFDLSLVADTSQTHIPHHGTPTVMLFGRNRRPKEKAIRVVMGRRGETGVPLDPANAPVWRSIADHWNTVGFENDYVSVVDVGRDVLSAHPWSLQGGGASALKERIENAANARLKAVISEVGVVAITGQDDVFLGTMEDHARVGVPRAKLRPVVVGDEVRDWGIAGTTWGLFPYDDSLVPALGDSEHRVLWPYRALLGRGVVFGKTRTERGMKWFEYAMLMSAKLKTKLSITFSFVATHNHFALDRSGTIFNRSAPVIKLPSDSTLDDHHALLAVLNSSTACFWMKQVFQPKGATSANRNHPDPERFAHEFTATGIEALPLPLTDGYQGELARLGALIDQLGQRRRELLLPDAWQGSLGAAEDLKQALMHRWQEHDCTRQRMIFAQEELDWLVYHLFGLTKTWLKSPEAGPGSLPRGQRAFELLNGHRSFVRDGADLLSAREAECETGSTTLPVEYTEISALRVNELKANEAVALIESYMHKRLWRDTEENIAERAFRDKHDKKQLSSWLLNRIEEAAAKRVHFTVPRIAADLMEQSDVLVVLEYLTGTRSFALDQLVQAAVQENAVPNHPAHIYTVAGQGKRRVWEEVWALQRREDAGEKVTSIPESPEYSQGSRGKSMDFVRNDYWRLRGKLDLPKERFIAFTEVPGRSGVETLYGWAGCTAQQRVKAILAIDEELEDASVPLADRIGLLDSAWRLLPDVAREDAGAATRLKAELQALVGPEGPSAALIEDWKKRFPPPSTRAARAKKAAIARDDDESDTEESDES
jgi:hypothetical protein